MWLLWIALVAAGWLALAVPAAVIVGRALGRAEAPRRAAGVSVLPKG